MNEFIQTMLNRRSIRSFKPDMPSKEDLELIVKAGLYAPNGMGRQSAIAIVITDKALRDELAEENRVIAGREGDQFYGAPAVIVVLADKSVPTYLYDGALMAGNMLQAANALGLGGIWIHRAKQEFEREPGKKLLKKLGIEGDYEGIGHCVIGYPCGDVPEAAPRREGREYWVE